MSADKKLDNTEISKQDVKELEDNKDNKLDETPKKSTNTKRKSGGSRSKKAKDLPGGSTDVSDSSPAHQASIPKDAANVHSTSLANIKGKLSDPKIQQEFVINVADLIGQYSKRKLTQDEVHVIQNVVDTNLLQKVFKISKI